MEKLLNSAKFRIHIASAWTGPRQFDPTFAVNLRLAEEFCDESTLAVRQTGWLEPSQFLAKVKAALKSTGLDHWPSSPKDREAESSSNSPTLFTSLARHFEDEIDDDESVWGYRVSPTDDSSFLTNLAQACEEHFHADTTQGKLTGELELALGESHERLQVTFENFRIDRQFQPVFTGTLTQDSSLFREYTRDMEVEFRAADLSKFRFELNGSQIEKSRD